MSALRRRGGRSRILVPTIRLGRAEKRLFVPRASVNPFEDQDHDEHQNKDQDRLKENRWGHDRPGLPIGQVTPYGLPGRSNTIKYSLASAAGCPR